MTILDPITGNLVTIDTLSRPRSSPQMLAPLQPDHSTLGDRVPEHRRVRTIERH